ncbi:hypothetical protein BJY00DRAFT_149032 [Aspergillus carlsbadensis]|nr:hypothetical protein BJY00DRAFT_149032 [Aspergillus carlsbadensis]
MRRGLSKEGTCSSPSVQGTWVVPAIPISRHKHTRSIAGERAVTPSGETFFPILSNTLRRPRCSGQVRPY